MAAIIIIMQMMLYMSDIKAAGMICQIIKPTLTVEDE